MNQYNYVVFDFETGGTDPEKCELLQLAAIAIDGRSLRLLETFQSYIKPGCAYEELDPQALAKNKIKKSDVENAPNATAVFQSFVNYVNKYSLKPGSGWDAPIPVGHNINNFDIPIINRLCHENKVLDKKTGRPILFNWRIQIDTMNFLFPWFENDPEVTSYSMDFWRPYFGIPKEGAHNAIVDVKQSAEIFIRFLKYHRHVISVNHPKFKGAFTK